MTIDALIIQCYKTVVFFMNYNILLSSCEYPVLVIFWELGGCHYTLIDVLLMKWVVGYSECPGIVFIHCHQF